MYLLLQFSNGVTWVVGGAAAPLGVEDKVGEVFLLGFDSEVVVSNAVPLVVEKADKSNDKEEQQTNSETGEANDMNSVIFLLQGV